MKILNKHIGTMVYINGLIDRIMCCRLRVGLTWMRSPRLWWERWLTQPKTWGDSSVWQLCRWWATRQSCGWLRPQSQWWSTLPFADRLLRSRWLAKSAPQPGREFPPGWTCERRIEASQARVSHCGTISFLLEFTARVWVFLLLPDGYTDQVHGGLIQALEEVPQRFPIIPHSAQDEAESNAEGD